MASFVAPLVSALIPGLAGLFGGQKKPTQQTSTTNSNQSFNQSGTSTTTPELSDMQQLLSKIFGFGAINDYGKGPGALLDNIRQTGLKSINRGSDIASKTVGNILASRGLSYSPAAAGALANPESQRIQQQSQLEESLPQIGYNIQQQNFQNLMNAFKTLPTGTSTTSNQSGTSTGNSTTTGTQLVPGNPLAGFTSGFGAGLFSPSGGDSNLSAILSRLFGAGAKKPSTGSYGEAGIE